VVPVAGLSPAKGGNSRRPTRVVVPAVQLVADISGLASPQKGSVRDGVSASTTAARRSASDGGNNGAWTTLEFLPKLFSVAAKGKGTLDVYVVESIATEE
jgi:hypothetical protein